MDTIFVQTLTQNSIIGILLIGISVSQPVISPNGTVDVLQGTNLTLTCTYQSKPSIDQFISWNLRKQGWTNFASALSVYKTPGSICPYFDGNLTLYGYSCPADNMFSITIYYVERSTSQGSTWTCAHQAGSAPFVESANVTINVQGNHSTLYK
ncbi:hypothetical protein DPMN_068519 [Dreissena polymorpha]|uniref:Ig-like domain-containing protein n=1 Tax=Dreissena polymorpha TaxID=45954 RepID=A0A9D3YZX9_DREPO|nr:hypothetical protein DPMN_068519 [Dreissena polymorpha]